MIEFDCEEVKRQLNRMAEALPDDKVAVWVAVVGGRVTYTCYVDNRSPYDSACGLDDILVKAVDDCLKSAGSRDGAAAITAKRKQIESARIDLAKLESELDPLVMAVDKAQTDFNEPKPPL